MKTILASVTATFFCVVVPICLAEDKEELQTVDPIEFLENLSKEIETVPLSFSRTSNKHPRLPASASELIEELKKAKGIYTTWEVKLNYVKEVDLPHLIELIDSKEPCAHSVMSWSSQIPSGESTVGNEAAYLIDSFMKRYYPTKLSSDKDPPNVQELKRWYSMWSALKKEVEQDTTPNR